MVPVINGSAPVSPSWWRWWHCSCCLCTASRAWRRHLFGIPGRPYPAGDRNTQKGEYVSALLCQQSENITQLLWVRCYRMLKVIYKPPTPPPPDVVHRNSLMLQYEMKQSSTWCSSAPFQTGRGRLSKQWASNQINIHVFPRKAKTNSLKQPTLLWS